MDIAVLLLNIATFLVVVGVGLLLTATQFKTRYKKNLWGAYANGLMSIANVLALINGLIRWAPSPSLAKAIFLLLNIYVAAATGVTAVALYRSAHDARHD